MEDYLINGGILSNIADKIRENDPDTYEGNAITPEEMPAAVDDVWQAGYSRGINAAGVADLTGTTWKFNDEIVINDYDDHYYNIEFISSNTSFNGLYYYKLVDDESGDETDYVRYSGPNAASAYSGNKWANGGIYQTIEITGGQDVTNSVLIDWLYTNGELVGGNSGIDAPTLVAGDNIEIIPDEEANTVEIKLADSIKLKGNYPLYLTRNTDEYKGVAYVIPPALKSDTINLYTPTKSGTLALLEDLAELEDGKDGLSTYLYNGVFDTTSLSWFEPEATPTIDMSDITIPTGRTLQVGDLLIDTVGTVAYVHYINLNTVEYVVKMSLGGGSSKAIIDVTELPTENINEEAFYRMLTAKWVANRGVHNSFTCYCVDNLPEVGEVATTDMTTITAYYCVADGVVYGYVDDMLGGYFGIPSGWYPADMLFSVAGIGYGGVITDIADGNEFGDFQVLLGYALYTCKDGKWEAVKGVGSVGTGVNAEVFNGTYNQASGDYSQARGAFTKAKGYASTAEGECTVAIGRNQHVQGQFNIEDTEEKYAHIVGNGEDGARSNAHTIDWQGNGWFAGTIKVGGTGQDDEEAKELATKEYVDSKIGGSADDTITITFNDNLTDIVFGTYYFSFEFTHQGETKLGYGMQFQNWGGSGAHLHYLIANGEVITVCTRYPGGEMNNWYGEEYKKITASAMPTDETLLAIFNTNTTVQGSPSSNNSNGFEMPQIRFTSMSETEWEDYPTYKFTVEIVGGGALQEGDTLQMCAKRMFGSKKDQEGNLIRPTKHKLRRFAEYTVTADDLNKRFLTVTVEVNGFTSGYLLRSNNKKGINLSPVYLRIRRPKGELQDNDTGMTVDATFSNVVTVWKTYNIENMTISLI